MHDFEHEIEGHLLGDAVSSNSDDDSKHSGQRDANSRLEKVTKPIDPPPDNLENHVKEEKNLAALQKMRETYNKNMLQIES